MRRAVLPAALAFVALAASAGDAPTDTEARLALSIANAVVGERPLPDVPASVDERTAYRIQAAWTESLYGHDRAGYKAGLTSAGAQQRFGIDSPVLGVLPASARLQPGADVEARPGLLLEVEIGFVVGSDHAPAAMMPVVELPRQSYEAPAHLDLADVVATNVAAYRFIAGAAVAVDAAGAETVVTLERDGEPVNRGVGREALGDPLEAYRWMVSRIVSLGYPLEPGMVMLTGALGRVVEAEPGRYVARYGTLGEVTFTIRRAGSGGEVTAPAAGTAGRG